MQEKIQDQSSQADIVQKKTEQAAGSYASKEGQKPTIQAAQSRIGAKQRPIQRKETGGQPIEAKQTTVQRKPNNTGLSDNLKSGIENLSGQSMDDVKVHYNSDKPAQLKAHAYAQGNQIHVAPGQEQHVPHEAWHVVQQKQGRVQPTTQLKSKGVQINDNAGLEREADVMGAKALQMSQNPTSSINTQASGQQTETTQLKQNSAPIQMVKESEFVADPSDFMSKNVVLFEYIKGFLQKYSGTHGALNGAVADNNLGANLKKLMVANKDAMSFYLEDSGNQATDGKKIYYTTPAIGLLAKSEIKKLFKNGDTPLENADALADQLIAEDGGGDNIRANYAPYFIGNPNEKSNGEIDTNSWENVGSTVVDPQVTNFVFTDAMNGCAYAITKVNGSDTKFEAWHFQSESDNWKQASHFRTTKGIRDWFGVNDYYIGDGTTNLAATNIIWNDGDEGQWKMLSQKNIVPLNGNDETVFQESTSTDLNVNDDMSEQSLDEVHRKLVVGAQRSIPARDIQNINRVLSRLTVTDASRKASTALINTDSTSMKNKEIAEINRISGNITQYNTDNVASFNTLEALGPELENISSSGMFGTSYDKNQTKGLKSRFTVASVNLHFAMQGLAGELNNVQVSDNRNEANADELQKLKAIRLYHDVYEDYDAYGVVHGVIGLISSLNNSKRSVNTRSQRFAQEKQTLFPQQND